MPSIRRPYLLGLLFASTVVSCIVPVSIGAAGQYLIGDRTLGRVLRYSEDGTFLGTLIRDSSLGAGVGMNDGGITGLTLSPDQSRLYVSDRLNNRIAVYNYTGYSASHLFDITAIAAAPSTLVVPSGTMFSQDGSTLYVANIGPFNQFQLPAGDRVGQVTPDGASAGPDLTGGSATGRAGFEFTPGGDLLVSTFNVVGSGGVLRFDSSVNQFVDFITPRTELRGAGTMLRVGEDLYVVAGYGGRLGKFGANTGALDTSFGTNGYLGPSVDFAFPASIALGPNGDSILVGILGATTGDSRIEEYDFDGNSLGVWATSEHETNFPPNGTGTAPSSIILGFSEPTGIAFSTIVPEPSSVLLVTFGLLIPGARSRSHARRVNEAY